MSQDVELSSLDMRYEGHRIRSGVREAHLLGSISERGIEEPLQGVDCPAGRLLLDGFKRYRCARKLAIEHVPYVSLGDEEAMGIIRLMRASKDQTLELLEEARFVVDLLGVHGLSTAEVAEKLGRGKSWVSMRRTLLEEMSETVREALFRGRFPVYSYLYTLRPFRRMNGSAGRASSASNSSSDSPPGSSLGPSAARRLEPEPEDPIDRFVKATSGKGLSVRDLELLAAGFFQGPASLREAIGSGKFDWSLKQMKDVPADPEGMSDFERVLLKDLHALADSLRRVTTRCQDRRQRRPAFYAQAHLLAGGLLANLEVFQESLREFYDRSGNAEGSPAAAPGRQADS